MSSNSCHVPCRSPPPTSTHSLSFYPFHFLFLLLFHIRLPLSHPFFALKYPELSATPRLFVPSTRRRRRRCCSFRDSPPLTMSRRQYVSPTLNLGFSYARVYESRCHPRDSTSPIHWMAQSPLPEGPPSSLFPLAVLLHCSCFFTLLVTLSLIAYLYVRDIWISLSPLIRALFRLIVLFRLEGCRYAFWCTYFWNTNKLDTCTGR